MRKLIPILIGMVLLVGCAGVNITPANDMDTIIDQLGVVHNKSIETQRKIAKGILDYVMFHLGSCSVHWYRRAYPDKHIATGG